MSYENIYYNPEKFDLEIVEVHDFSDGNYCFDYRVIWKDNNGKLYTARDSGCSCPSPFEDYAKVADLEDFSASHLIEEAREEAIRGNYSGDPIEPWVTEIRKIERNRVAREKRKNEA